MLTTIPRETPLFLRQDVTNNPLWTGKDAGLAAEDEHMSKFLKKYEGFESASLSGSSSGSSAAVADIAQAELPNRTADDR